MEIVSITLSNPYLHLFNKRLIFGCFHFAAKSQVHNVINKLYTTTQTVLQLHANLRNCEDSLMLKELENAVIMTQNMLTNITQNK